MSEDQNHRARAAGKAAIAASTVWSLQIGPLKLRCIKSLTGLFVVQGLAHRNVYTEITSGDDPIALLRKTVMSDVVNKAVK